MLLVVLVAAIAQKQAVEVVRRLSRHCLCVQNLVSEVLCRLSTVDDDVIHYLGRHFCPQMQQQPQVAASHPLGGGAPPVPAAGGAPMAPGPPPPAAPVASASAVELFLGRSLHWRKPTDASVPQSAAGLAQLAAAGAWVALARLADRLAPTAEPAHALQIRFQKVTALLRVRNYRAAADELAALGDLDAPAYSFEAHPTLYPGQRGESSRAMLSLAGCLRWRAARSRCRCRSPSYRAARAWPRRCTDQRASRAHGQASARGTHAPPTLPATTAPDQPAAGSMVPFGLRIVAAQAGHPAHGEGLSRAAAAAATAAPDSSSRALNALLLLVDRCAAAAAAAVSGSAPAPAGSPPPGQPAHAGVHPSSNPNSLALEANGRAAAIALANLYIQRREYHLAIAQLEALAASTAPGCARAKVPAGEPPAAGGVGGADGVGGRAQPAGEEGDVLTEPLSLLGRLQLQVCAACSLEPPRTTKLAAPLPSGMAPAKAATAVCLGCVLCPFAATYALACLCLSARASVGHSLPGGQPRGRRGCLQPTRTCPSKRQRRCERWRRRRRRGRRACSSASQSRPSRYGPRRL